MEVIEEPGKIDDLVADAAACGHQITPRLIRDWSERGLLDYPQRRSAGKGHGSAPALYPANQRNLLLTLLHHRPTNHINSLARIPVGIWMYWGEEYVPLRQARRALMTWIGDGRSNLRRAREVARSVLGQLDSPHATEQARRELVEVLANASYKGQVDFDHLEQAVRAVFEPGSNQIRRVVGHLSAPIMTESFIGAIKARLLAATELTKGRVSDDALRSAREAHLFAYAEYAARQPFLAADAPADRPNMYEPVTAENSLNNCCLHLLSATGLELMFPERAKELRQAWKRLPRPTATTLGFVARPT